MPKCQWREGGRLLVYFLSKILVRKSSFDLFLLIRSVLQMRNKRQMGKAR